MRVVLKPKPVEIQVEGVSAAIEALDTPGGHIAVGLLVLLLGLLMVVAGENYGREIAAAAMSWMVRSMWGAQKT